MSLKWQKLGLVFCPNGDVEWMRSHASNPVVEHLNGNLFRVYFSSRDSKNRSQIASLVMELADGKASVVDASIRLVLTHGKHGRFDDSGVTVTGLAFRGTQRLLYYLGWNLAVTIPFRNAIGVAVAEQDSQEFLRVSEAPVVDRNNDDPISLSYPFLLWDDGRFRIWYGSCTEWSGSTVSDYEFSLKYAESIDGLTWTRTSKVVLGCNFPNEDAIARPHVIRENGVFKMWYSRKKGAYYRMGYAESVDGKEWLRMDDRAGIDVSPHNDWDSEMIEYPFVFDHKDRRYMLYNGNGYGKTGFGLAVLGT
jgi:hypothetical protein